MNRPTEQPAGPETARTSVVRFGFYEADVKAEIVRSKGSRVRLQQQPFHVLAVLLERPGQVVTREELRARLWPNDLHVDFEHGLNTAIRKLRPALNDSPEQPRYVETVRGRGYRFIARVERARAPGEAIGRPWRSRRGGRLWAVLAGLAVLTATLATWTLRSRETHEPPPRVSRLTAYPGAEYQPTFSPDGTHVAFTWRQAGNEDIYVQPVGIPEPRALAEGPEVEHSPTWSPDGRWIAFIRDPIEPEGEARVVLAPPGGGAERVVTEYVGPRVGGLWLRELAWSPDSRYLVLSRPDEGRATWNLYAIDVLDGGARRLTESPDADHTPAISPDGRTLAFSRSSRSLGLRIYVMPLSRVSRRRAFPRRSWTRSSFASSEWSAPSCRSGLPTGRS